MPRTTKDSQFREDEDERDDLDVPLVDEDEVEEDDRVTSSKVDEDAEDEADDDDDHLVEDIDLDDLSAMEGPDA
jgi:hypothetical protein